MKYVQCIQQWKPTRIFNHLPNSCIKEVNFEKNCILQGRWAKVEEVLYLYQLLKLEQDMLKMSLLKRTFFSFFFSVLRQWPNKSLTNLWRRKLHLNLKEFPSPKSFSCIRVLQQSRKWASLFFISQFMMYNSDYINFLMSELLASGCFVYSRNVRLFKLPEIHRCYENTVKVKIQIIETDSITYIKSFYLVFSLAIWETNGLVGVDRTLAWRLYPRILELEKKTGDDS